MVMFAMTRGRLVFLKIRVESYKWLAVRRTIRKMSNSFLT